MTDILDVLTYDQLEEVLDIAEKYPKSAVIKAAIMGFDNAYGLEVETDEKFLYSQADVDMYQEEIKESAEFIAELQKEIMELKAQNEKWIKTATDATIVATDLKKRIVDLENESILTKLTNGIRYL